MSHIPPLNPDKALTLEVQHLSKRFGAFTALNDVSMHIAPGTVHALLGENGAGKSTLVKCIAGFQPADEGRLLINGQACSIPSPAIARELGIGMVYQHFTLAPGMTVAENLLLAGGHTPAVINWKRKYAELTEFLASTPFQLDLKACPATLSAGEKQKLELLKQLYLHPRLLILDEPTSVLTPQEADEVLGHIRDFARRGHCTILLITHKFREVMAYADTVTVLRHGRTICHSPVADTSPAALASAMIGETMAKAAFSQKQASGIKTPEPGNSLPMFQVEALSALGDHGTQALHEVSLSIRAGEILGIAGVAGNGQRELVEALVGQRPRQSGRVKVAGQPYHARRAENRQLKVRCLPEEPMRNACVDSLSVAENMTLRDFDHPPYRQTGWLRFSLWRRRARDWIAEYGIKTRGENAPLRSLSGGNAQRVVLARELTGEINVLIVSNPVFGLDFAAVQDIHVRLRQVRQGGSAILLLSEDLDELLALSDHIAVMSGGRIVFETPIAQAERTQIGKYMGGHRPNNPKTY